jgi:23S rRNA pseudouridine1911/1915/1917 synthase
VARLPEKNKTLKFQVEAKSQSWRLDRFLASRLNISRSHLQKLIENNHVTVNGQILPKRHLLETGDRISVTLQAPEQPDLEAQPIPFSLLYEEEEFIVINKPAGISVHPASGQQMITLVHGLLYRFPQLSDAAGFQRPGIVHRLDRFTSGVMLVAKSNRVHCFFAKEFAEHRVQKTYLALVEGNVEFDQNIIEAPIARHKQHREKMQVSKEGKKALTRVDVIKRFDKCTFLKCQPQSGRRHQIRVHLKYLGHPIFGDQNYGGQFPITTNSFFKHNEKHPRILMERLALHALRIEIAHPFSKKTLSFEAPLPADFQTVMDFLENPLNCKDSL